MRMLLLSLVSLGTLAAQPATTDLLSVGRLYVTDVEGFAQINNLGGQLETLAPRGDYPATEKTLRTGPKAWLALLLSNNVGYYQGSDTMFTFDSVTQAPYKGLQATTGSEPSSSRMEAHLHHGYVALCVPLLHATSQLNIRTPRARITVQGRIALESKLEQDILTVLQGTVTLQLGATEQVITAPKQVLVTTGLRLQDIPSAELTQHEDRASNIACRTRQVATYEGDAAGADTNFTARAVVPLNLPVNIVVSPDRLP